MPSLQKWKKQNKQVEENLGGSREKIIKWDLADCKIEWPDFTDPEAPLSLGSLPSNTTKLGHVRMSFPCQDLKSFFFFSLLECLWNTQYRVVVPLRRGRPEPPWVFCKQAAACSWVLPFCAIVPLGVSSEDLQPHSKDSSESVMCLSPKKWFFKNVPSGEMK